MFPVVANSVWKLVGSLGTCSDGRIILEMDSLGSDMDYFLRAIFSSDGPLISFNIMLLQETVYT